MLDACLHGKQLDKAEKVYLRKARQELARLERLKEKAATDPPCCAVLMNIEPYYAYYFDRQGMDYGVREEIPFSISTDYTGSFKDLERRFEGRLNSPTTKLTDEDMERVMNVMRDVGIGCCSLEWLGPPENCYQTKKDVDADGDVDGDGDDKSNASCEYKFI